MVRCVNESTNIRLHLSSTQPARSRHLHHPNLGAKLAVEDKLWIEVPGPPVAVGEVGCVPLAVDIVVSDVEVEANDGSDFLLKVQSNIAHFLDVTDELSLGSVFPSICVLRAVFTSAYYLL
jgi:hypothetical protein